jgi:hypothetical protein
VPRPDGPERVCRIRNLVRIIVGAKRQGLALLPGKPRPLIQFVAQLVPFHLCLCSKRATVSLGSLRLYSVLLREFAKLCSSRARSRQRPRSLSSSSRRMATGSESLARNLSFSYSVLLSLSCSRSASRFLSACEAPDCWIAEIDWVGCGVARFRKATPSRIMNTETMKPAKTPCPVPKKPITGPTPLITNRAFPAIEVDPTIRVAKRMNTPAMVNRTPHLDPHALARNASKNRSTTPSC